VFLTPPACRPAGDDVQYLIKSYMGENTLMIGTDYGHADSATELDALTMLKDSGGISAEIHRKSSRTTADVLAGT